MTLFEVDWHEMFVPQNSLLDIAIRGTLTYLMLFAVMRFILKRQTGVIGIADLLVVVMIADATQNAMAAEYKSITEGTLLVLTIVFWNFFLNWLGYRFPSVQRLIRPPPLQLVKEGRMMLRNMRRELITTDELASQLRQQGVERVSEVKSAFIEGDGRVSVITYDKDEERPQNPGDNRIA